jgi:hypothetical protein
LGAGRKAETLLFKEVVVEKSKDVKTGCNLGEYPKEDCDSKKDRFVTAGVPTEVRTGHLPNSSTDQGFQGFPGSRIVYHANFFDGKPEY